MLNAAFSVLAVAVLLGSALALMHLREGAAPPPWPLGALHGLIALAGLGLLALALRGPPRGLDQGTGSFGIIAAALIALAALVGLDAACRPAAEKAAAGRADRRPRHAGDRRLRRSARLRAGGLAPPHMTIIGSCANLPSGRRPRRRQDQKTGRVEMTFKTKTAALLLALAIVLPAGGALAQGKYPDHPVHVLVGYPPGGPVDIIARIMSDKLGGLWGQAAVVENITGASGNIAADRAAHSTPDGYTLLVSTNAQLVVNPSLYKMTFDPAKDLTPISLAVYSPNILVVPNDVPAKNVKELVEYLHAHPGKSFASAGIGTTQHLAGELFKSMAQVDIQHVPYRGAAPVITDLLAGRITMFFGAISPLIPLVRQGKLRALAVTSEKRFPAMPELPTMIEAGYPGFVSVLSMGLVAPAGTPPAIVEKIHQDCVKVLAMPEVKAKLANIGMEVIGSSPAEFAATMAAERPQWAKVIKDAGIKPSN